MTTKQITLLPKINELIQELKPDNISAERKKTLQPLIDLIQDKTANNQEIRLNFICIAILVVQKLRHCSQWLQRH